MAKKITSCAIPFLVVLVLLVSGCSIGGGGGSGASRILSIETFEPDLSGVDIMSGEPVKFTLIVRNTGTEAAKDVKAEIIGLDGWTKSSTGNTCDSPFSLTPPNPEFNTPGQSRQCIFSYTAPESLPLDQTFQPKASITYIYDSATVARVRILSREKFIIKRDGGEPVDSETVFKSNSPIDIDLSTRGQAAQVRLVGDKAKFPIFITVNNADGGFVCADPGSCQDTLKKIGLGFKAGSDKLSLENCKEEMEIDLFKGQKGELKCDATATYSSAGLTEEMVSITATSKGYGYTVERAGPVMKVKRE